MPTPPPPSPPHHLLLPLPLLLIMVDCRFRASRRCRSCAHALRRAVGGFTGAPRSASLLATPLRCATADTLVEVLWEACSTSESQGQSPGKPGLGMGCEDLGPASLAFRYPSGLVTNFHAPDSTLMALVSALLGGAPRARALYAHAVELLVLNASRPVSTAPISLHLL